MKIETQVTLNSILNSICLVIVAIFAILAFTWSMPHEEKQIGYDTATEYIRELHVAYQGVKSDLVDVTQHYIDSVAPNSGLRALVIVENCEQYSVPVSFVLAQAEKESAFGTTGLAFRTNSVWNVGAYDGHGYDEIHYKHKFDNPNESVEPYLSLLVNNYLPNKTIEDLLDSYVDVNGNRYASDKNYEASLRAIMTKIKNNYNIDELQSRLNYYKVRLQ